MTLRWSHLGHLMCLIILFHTIAASDPGTKDIIYRWLGAGHLHFEAPVESGAGLPRGVCNRGYGSLGIAMKRQIIGLGVALVMTSLGCTESASSALTPLDVGVNSGEADGAVHAGRWQTVHPGGDTLCSRGDPYRFYFRAGDSRKLVVYFQGGGACWNEFTCSVADAIFSDKVNEPEDLNTWTDDRYQAGLFDTSPNGLFADWSILYVPYCTGDVHWGNATVDYNDRLTIHHRGYLNTKAALEFAYARVEDPSSVFVTGCSAGAYGSILNSARIATQYPDAIVSVLADSGAGIITNSFLLDSFPNWNALSHLPEYLERLQAPLETLSIEDVYISIAETFPNHRFSQYTTAFDQDQIFYWEAMGGDFREFAPRLKASLDNIEGAVPNFRAYYAPGSMHCITVYPFFDTRTVAGVRFKSWLEQLVVGDMPPDSVRCSGDSCFDDPVCNACAEDASGPGCNFCSNWPDRHLDSPEGD